jgi:abortive infection bacteriophage resistance protein
MIITEPAKAASCLERIGYYRLSGYWYPMRKSAKVLNPNGNTTITVFDNFRDGVEFLNVMNLYVFDKKLRMLILDAIERVEVGLRVAVALELGRRDPRAHLNPSELHGKFSKKPAFRGANTTHHGEWLKKYRENVKRSNEEFVTHFYHRYPDDELPIWMAIELWDFGGLSHLLAGMKIPDQDALARKFSINDRELFVSWVRAINGVRNACAHHSRIWNKPLVDNPVVPKPFEDTVLHHIRGNTNAQTRLYAVAVALQFLMRTINPTSTWGARLKQHWSTFVPSPGVELGQTGFPAGWDALPLWR